MFEGLELQTTMRLSSWKDWHSILYVTLLSSPNSTSPSSSPILALSTKFNDFLSPINYIYVSIVYPVYMLFYGL